MYLYSSCIRFAYYRCLPVRTVYIHMRMRIYVNTSCICMNKIAKNTKSLQPKLEVCFVKSNVMKSGAGCIYVYTLIRVLKIMHDLD